MSNFTCPKCRSHRVKASYPDIECLACGWSEPLIDYPISFNEHRRLCSEFGRLDPGPDEPAAHNLTLTELHERILTLEIAQSEKPQVDRPRSERKSKAEGVRL